METENFYFDTSIWLDLYENRGINGLYAKKLLEKLILENKTIFYSDINIVELKKLKFSEYEINQIFRIAKSGKLKQIHVNKLQIEESNILAKQRNVPMRDAMHSILARDNESILLSRDYHFDSLKDISITNKPEDLINFDS